MLKIGLFGGTFDPIHNGHLVIAEKTVLELGLDRVIFIPAGDPPHKTDKEVTPKSIRYQMTCLAASAFDWSDVSDFELERDTLSYSVDTVKHFRAAYPEDELYFVIGADSFADMPSWWHYRELMSLCKIIVFSRPDTKKEDYLKRFDGDEKPPRVFLIDNVHMDISSTQIREMLGRGEDVSRLIPPAVNEYIKQHGLYRHH